MYSIHEKYHPRLHVILVKKKKKVSESLTTVCVCMHAKSLLYNCAVVELNSKLIVSVQLNSILYYGKLLSILNSVLQILTSWISGKYLF